MNPASPRATRAHIFGMLLLALLCVLAIALSAAGSRLYSLTIDEPWHAVAGASYVRANDFRLNPEQPPLVKLWAGAFLPDTFRLPALPTLKEKIQEREFVQDVFYRDNDDRLAQQALRRAMWALHAILMFVLGLLCWRTFGLAWAAGTLAFLAIEPTIGAHLPVVMTDLALGLTLPIAALCAGLLFATWRWRWAVALGVAVALVLGAKHSALPGLLGLALACLVFALLPAREAAPARSVRLAQLGVAGLLGIALLWAQYGFHFHAGADGGDRFNQAMPDKIAGLQIEGLRKALGFMDRARVLPRSYLWGLADTVRAGVEGRGQSEHLVWGTIHAGAPPWFTWPSVVVSKLPLALLGLALLGAVAAWRMGLSSTARLCLLALAAVSLTHLLALMSSQGTYAGVRHALPIVVALAIVAGAAIAHGWQRQSRPWLAAAAASLLLALAMTAREPRLWEYHNELAGGTDRAWRQFGNEGVDLGQRFHEALAFYRSDIRASGEPLFYDYGFNRQQAARAGLPLRYRVESMDDENARGIYTGWFIIATPMNMAWPSAGWDPKVGLRGLHRVQRLGQIEIWRGRQELPLLRAGSMSGRIMDYLYKQRGTDWALVERRAAEVMQVMPSNIGIGVELGNARLRLGDADGARQAYQGLLDQTQRPLDGLVRKALEAQVARIDAGVPAAQVPAMRNPWME